MIGIAQRAPERAWKLSYSCIRYLLRLQRFIEKQQAEKELDPSSFYKFDREIKNLLEIFARILTAVGQKLLKDDFFRFSKFSLIASQHPSKLIQRSFILIWQEVESCKAEEAIKWLITSPELTFAAGDSEDASRYAPRRAVDKTAC